MTVTSLPRSCPRCSGLLLHARDAYGGYSSCLCCGFVLDWLSAPTIDLPDDATPGSRQRRRQPSHGKVRL